MSDPTLYRIDQRFIPSMMHTDAEGSVHIDGVLVPVEPDYEAMATEMNVEGWTCDGHEPGAWCEDCKRLQLSTARKMWRAGIGGDELPLDVWQGLLEEAAIAEVGGDDG